MMFRKYYEETVRERLEQIYRARDFYRDSDVAPSNASDSSSSRHDGDDGKLKTSEKKTLCEDICSSGESRRFICFIREAEYETKSFKKAAYV